MLTILLVDFQLLSLFKISFSFTVTFTIVNVYAGIKLFFSVLSSSLR